MKKECVLTILIISLLIGFAAAEKLNIEILDQKEVYSPGDKINFKLTLYKDNLEPTKGIINYEIQNFYSETEELDTATSGEIITFKIPIDAQGFWGIIAKQGDLEKKELFEIKKLEKLNIQIQQGYLVILNQGNTPVESHPLFITIGDQETSTLLSLEPGQTRKIKLTAPEGNYNIKVNDEERQIFSANSIPLTGNVIAIKTISEKGFLKQYPLILIFAFILIGLIITITATRPKNINTNLNTTKQGDKTGN